MLRKEELPSWCYIFKALLTEMGERSDDRGDSSLLKRTSKEEKEVGTAGTVPTSADVEKPTPAVTRGGIQQ